MHDTTHLLAPFVRDALWQSSAIFIVALFVVRCIVRRPARAHAVLVLAFIAAVAAPVASQIVRQRGWGVLPPVFLTVERQTPSTGPTDLPVPGQPVKALAESTPVGVPGDSALRAKSAAGVANRSADSAQIVIREPAGIDGIPTAAVATFLAIWLVASILVTARLMRGMLAGARLLTLAERCAQPTVADALATARQRLALGDVSIDVYQSPAVRCPMIWCWGRRPCVLLPIDAVASWSGERWIPILTHELAHWKRRDHWAAFSAEIVCCLLPWQLLAWWAKRRLETASEQACDDWTVAAGHSAVDYAETLLGLAAQADPPLALAALRRRSTLAARVQHILSGAVPHPRLGRLWGLAVLLVTVATVGVTALCQRGVAWAESQPPATATAEQSGKTPPAPTASPEASTIPAAAPEASDKPEHIRAHGRVLTTDDKPVAAAEVYWDVLEHRPNVTFLVVRTVASAKTDADGQFTMQADLVRSNAMNPTLVIRAKGYGVQGSPRPFFMQWEQPSPEFRLEPSAVVEGTILTPDGQPLAGARVMITAISQQPDPPAPHGWSLMLTDKEADSDQPRPYWPAPVVTDADGKFRFADAIPRRAVAELLIQAAGFAATRVSIAQPDALQGNPSRKKYRQLPVKLVLETPRVIHGRFLDEETGAPVPGVRFEVTPFSSGFEHIVEATSDAEGRCTLRLEWAQHYFTKAAAPLGYPGTIGMLDRGQYGQLTGPDQRLEYEARLRRGITLKGRVLDAQNGDGVPQAQVEYHPERGRQLGPNNVFFPVATDADGHFELTAVAGQGFVLADAPGKGFYRLAVVDPRIVREVICPNGLAEVDVPAEGQTEALAISLHRGPPLLARAFSEQGKPIQQLEGACVECDFTGIKTQQSSDDGLYRLDAAQPGRKYRLFLFSGEARSGAIAEVVAPADGQPVDVKLQRCGTIRGRYVYAGGQPATNIYNFTLFRWYSEREPRGEPDGNLPNYDNFFHPQDGKCNTGTDGSFELTGIIPGAFIYLRLNEKFADGKRTHAVGVLEPGEIKNVGDLIIQSAQ